jgi:aryl-alcohol dehydrogenase
VRSQGAAGEHRVDLDRHLVAGRSLQGVIQGDSVPQEMIPMLARRVGSGELPLARLVSFYPLSEINAAASDAHAGRTIKPVLRMA